jgi:hypothetical protein
MALTYFPVSMASLSKAGESAFYCEEHTDFLIVPLRLTDEDKGTGVNDILGYDPVLNVRLIQALVLIFKSWGTITAGLSLRGVKFFKCNHPI